MVTRCSKEGRNDERQEEEDETIQVSLCPRGFDFFSLYLGTRLWETIEKETERLNHGIAELKTR